jgi:site-specific recombinase XerC
MFDALSDFIIYCRVERRLSELTRRAYERDVRPCLQMSCRSSDWEFSARSCGGYPTAA